MPHTTTPDRVAIACHVRGELATPLVRTGPGKARRALLNSRSSAPSQARWSWAS